MAVWWDPDENQENEIASFFHCSKCLKDKPAGVTPRQWARMEAGVCPNGDVQFWCIRHDRVIMRMCMKPVEGVEYDNPDDGTLPSVLPN